MTVFLIIIFSLQRGLLEMEGDDAHGQYWQWPKEGEKATEIK